MKIILVHGFNKNKKDMIPMAKLLEQRGFQCLLPNLPLRYQEFDLSVSQLAKYLIKYVEMNEKVHLVGHSTGGLVIRKLISNGTLNNKIKRAVLIASPNKGSQLAQIANKYKVYVNIFKTLKSLDPEYVAKLDLIHDRTIEIGAIAGNKKGSILSKLIKGENDGRVEIDSVIFNALTDYTVLPYWHKEIHRVEETADQVVHFLNTGHFIK
ncbi:lipase family alpha/beta hydrolase [Bacillaceae bacterium W0354]